MQISDFTFRIILLFIPGLVTFYIVDKLTVHRETKFHNVMLYSILYGLICYLVFFLITLIPFLNLKFYFLDLLTNSNAPLIFREILIVSTLAIIIGFFITFLSTYKILSRVAHLIGITYKFGDVDVWSFVMNLKIPGWVVVRDFENDLMYEGWVKAFSDSTERDELFLVDVIVYREFTGEKLYEVSGLYLPRKRENLVIEFPDLKRENKKEKAEENKHE